VARVLIVGCGCRGRELAAALARAGHSVRGTTRDPARARDIEAAGVEAVVADPDRLGTLVPNLEGVSAACWLLGPVDEQPLHGPRLESFLEHLVDTPVRGLVYEASARHPAGRDIARRAGERYRMPVEIVEAGGGEAASAVERVLA
jgi:uncharacterized protein YbjT (DUF2867 family)